MDMNPLKEIPWVCNIFRTQVILSIYPNTPWQILHITFLPFRISVEFWLSVHEYIKSEAKLYKWITAKNFILLSHEISFSMLSNRILRILIPFFASLSIKLCNSKKLKDPRESNRKEKQRSEWSITDQKHRSTQDGQTVAHALSTSTLSLRKLGHDTGKKWAGPIINHKSYKKTWRSFFFF